VVIKVDLRILPDKFKAIVLNDLNLKYSEKIIPNQDHNDTDRLRSNNKDKIGQVNEISTDILTLDLHFKGDHKKLERFLKDILIKHRIDNYVVIIDEKERDKILILNKEHSEQIGIYHCRHCGMSFDDEIQLSTHLRMHFFI
jgi:hypothetical protein